MLNQQNDNGSNQDKGKEGGVEFVVACKNSAKPFELLKETFNQMPLLVGVPVYGPRVVDIVLWRDRIGGVLGKAKFTNCFCAICFVTKNIAALDLNLAEQGYRMFGVMVISGTEQKGHRISQSIHYGMNFSISAAF